MDAMIDAQGVTKRFRTKGEYITAVDHIDLCIQKNEIFGLIGPTVSLKTTIIKMFSTLVLPDEGSITINGFNVLKEENNVKELLGVLVGEFTRSLYWRLTGRQNLDFFAKLRNMWHPEQRIDYLLDLLRLKEWENQLVMRYSTGMKHKLALAITLLSDPPILFLDEPLTGVDPVTSLEIKHLIKEDFKEKTVLWASHNLYEIEEMCDRIGLLNQGRFVLTGSVDELKKKYWDYEKILLVTDKPSFFLTIHGAETSKEGVEIKTHDVTGVVKQIMDICDQNDIRIREIKTVKPSLEEIFMAGVKNAR